MYNVNIKIYGLAISYFGICTLDENDFGRKSLKQV